MTLPCIEPKSSKCLTLSSTTGECKSVVLDSTELFDIVDFKKCFFESTQCRSLITDNTLGIYITGSRGLGINHSKSDFDIIIITTEESRKGYSLSSYKGVTAHIGGEYNYLDIWKKQHRFTNKSVLSLQLPLTNIILYEKDVLSNYIKEHKDFLTGLGARIVLDSAKKDLEREIGLLSGWTKNKYNLILAAQAYTGEIDLKYVKDIKARCTDNKIRYPERQDIDLSLLKLINSIDQTKLDEDILLVNNELSKLLK